MNSFEKLELGFKLKHGYKITPQIHSFFLNTFEDKNALHHNESYAKQKGFQSVVMHGGILAGFVSHFVGQALPVQNTVLLSTEYRFLKPNFVNDALEIEGEITQKTDAAKAVVFHLKIFNKTQEYLCARVLLQVGFLE